MRRGRTEIGRSSRCRVFEIRNQTLREIFIAATRFSLDVVIRRNLKKAPEQLAHWNFKHHDLIYTEIEEDIPYPSKRSFLRGYARASALKGWKIIADKT